jgi:hypothetical protein
MPKKPNTKEELLALLYRESIVDEKTECRVWTGHRVGKADGKGYGGIVLSEPDKRTKWRVHRLMWEIHHGDIPEGLLVRHFCHNRLCINIDHLGIGTHKDNYDDARKAGRHTHGELASWLTEEQVKEIKRLGAEGVPQRKIAKQFGIASKSTVGRILRGQAWSHVT